MSVPSNPPEPNPRIDAEHVRAWVECHQTWLWRYLRFLSAAPDVAEDICQDTLVAALQHQIPSRDRATAMTWLRTTARNLYRRHFRGAERRAAMQEMLARDAEVTEADLLREADDEPRERLRACLEQLPDHGRQLLDLRYRDSASRKEIARALDRSEEAVKTMLRRIKQTLRDCINRKSKGTP